MDKTEVLRKYFGHKAFRGVQEEVIDNILGGRDCLAVMPTGAGKSVCFQVPAMMSEGITLVISPLISLMKDQVGILAQNGVPAVCINSSLSESETAEAYRSISAGNCKLVYVAPERLSNAGFAAFFGKLNITLAAVDEAHCVSQWGQDFRPSYLAISGFVNGLSKRPVIAAFTATATEYVKRDICEILELHDPYVVTSGFDRPNLYFDVRSPENKDIELLNLLRNNSGKSSIVYCMTRKNVESVCELLNVHGIRAGKYHAGLSAEERTAAQDDFLYDRIDVMVATNAFGMGIDKSNVSLVVHYNITKDVESYYQEAGRAGRDGSSAECVLLYSPGDMRLANYLIDVSHEDPQMSDEERETLKKRDKARLHIMNKYAKTKSCLRNYILNYFGENVKHPCGNCGTCLKNYDMIDVTVETQKILSCIFRLKQRGFTAGINTVCMILHGEPSEKEYSELSTFGIIADKKIDDIRQIADFLWKNGYFDVIGDNGICALNSRSSSFIKSKDTVIMRVPKRKLQSMPAAEEGHFNPDLFEKLRAVRKAYAQSLGVPPYVVFSDASLWSMCALLPKNIDEFLQVNGVGTMKAERYGRKFLAVINDYCNSK